MWGKFLTNGLLYFCIFITFASCGLINNISADEASPNALNSENQQNNEQLPLTNSADLFASVTASPVPTQIPATSTTPQIIASYTTVLKDNGKNRVKNICIAVGEIDGYTLAPGEVFSFNDVVGRRTSSKGYKPAKIIMDGKVDWGVGGGICQLSSTIYNAAKKAGMTIVEKHSHSVEIGYVPPGCDATVNFGTLDLKFKNPNNFPIIIDVNVKNNRVYSSIAKT